MGANIQVEGKTAIIDGVQTLRGCEVRACDLRAGAAMVIAAMCAEGMTLIEDAHFIERGYEDIVGKPVSYTHLDVYKRQLLPE